MNRKEFPKYLLKIRHFNLLMSLLTISIFVNVTIFFYTSKLQIFMEPNVLKQLDIIFKEELIGRKDLKLTFRISRLSATRNVQTLLAVTVKFEQSNAIYYVYKPYNNKIYTKGNIVNLERQAARTGSSPKMGTTTGIQRYFETLRTPTGHCRKLVRFGGEITCDGKGDENGMDGNKLICIHPAFRVNSIKDQNCLVFSFGIEKDTSFDEDMASFNCQVHMFDIFNYSKEYFQKDNKLHFHQIGLATYQHRDIYAWQNITVDFDNFNNIAVDLGLQDQLITILKIDIEGNEWDVLHDLSSKSYLSAIGQIAIEVHAMDLLKQSHEEQLKKTQYRMNALEALEAKGFRRVAYWDNNNPKYDFTDADGSVFSTAGELLLVNSNWYNKSFWTELFKDDFNVTSTK